MKINLHIHGFYLLGWISLILGLVNSHITYTRDIISTGQPICFFPIHYMPNLSKHIQNTDELIKSEYKPASNIIKARDNVMKNPLDFIPWETAFQLSGKILLYTLNNVYLYGYYTQHSYWQCYVHSPFFRATDYKPGIFIEKLIKLGIDNHLSLNIRLGIIHRSNGLGTPNERSWNRIYGSCQMNRDHVYLLIKFWHIIHNSIEKYNSDIAEYLGYGKLELGYHFSHCHDIKMIFQLFGKNAFRVQYLIPMTPNFQCIVQGFIGHGHNIMFYNEFSSSVSIGIAVNNAF